MTDADLEELQHPVVETSETKQIFGGDPMSTEASDSDGRSPHRKRRNDDVHARSVRKTSIDHGRGFIDTSTEGADDSLDDAPKSDLATEAHGRSLETSIALDEDRIRTVDHDLSRGLIGEQRLERTQTERLIEDELQKIDPSHPRGGRLRIDERAQNACGEISQDLVAHTGHILTTQIELCQQSAVQSASGIEQL